MRCKYCGWDNPAGSANCCKCNQVLSADYSSDSPKTSGPEFNPRMTVSENAVFSNTGQKCKHCGYPVMPGIPVCPSCRMPQTIDRAEREPATAYTGFGRQTVRPNKRHHCSLRLIPEDNEKIAPVELSFSGEEIVLNRSNTEPGNPTITSKEQAVLICEGKSWYIQDRSQLKTTYVQASDKIKLDAGDIIILGDRRFQFGYD
jgi:hypothetical protein